jgi:pimeloyl-ACP methyl ester carboxylesterase
VTVSTPTSKTLTVNLYDGLSITVDKRGTRDSAAVLMLHGGAGPRSVAGFAAALSEQTYVITPTHPGFDGTPRPDWTESITDLADAYLDLIERLGLRIVMVIGSSFGGWIAAEMALRDTRGRIRGLIMSGGVGIEPEPPLEIADPAKVGQAEFLRMAFHNPDLRPDPATMSEEQRTMIAANARTTAGYTAGSMYDPKLHRRLHRVTIPVLVLAGEQDGVVPLEYSRAFAGAFPRSRFVPISNAAHFPHMEQPGQTLAAIGDFVQTEIKPDGR